MLAGVPLLAGCADLSPQFSLREKPPEPMPVPQAGGLPTDGAIYAEGSGIALLEDAKARNIGDVVTILLVESTSAQKKAATNTSKASALDLTNIQVFGKNIGTNTGATGTRTFAGEGDSAQSNSLQGSVTAIVFGRMPNGMLQVRGEKQIELNQGSEVVRIEGLVRPVDIASDNSVTSDRIANARLSYKGRGALADANSQGWLSRFFNSPWFPF